MPRFSHITIYEAKFKTKFNAVETTVTVRILPKEYLFFEVRPTTYISLNDDQGRLPEGTLVISTVDNDDNPFTPIKSKTATLKFFAEGISLKTFAVGESNQWLMWVYLGDVVTDEFVVYKGFLIMDVSKEPFEPKPYEVVLTANDNIGALKNTALTDFDDKNPTHEHKVIQYIAWALAKTGIFLPIYVANNLMEESSPGVPFYESCYLHAKTFEKSLTSEGAVSEDCYTVLTKILGNDSRLLQKSGAWWIERIYEKQGTAQYVHQFNYDGTYVGVSAATFYQQTIDRRGDVDFINDNAEVTIRSPYKKVELEFKYEYPQEIVDNIDFSRGDLFTPLDMSPVTIDGELFYQSKFHIADWTPLVGSGGIENGGSPSTTNNYIRKLYKDSTKTVEAQRYVVIEGTGPGGAYYIKSNKVPVQKNDKIDISVDSRYSADVFPGSGSYRLNTIQVRLTANDGTFYTLNGGQKIGTDNYALPEWRITSGSFTSNNRYFVIEGNFTEDLAQWKTCSWIVQDSRENPCPPIPKDGYIEVLLIHNQSSSYVADRHFNNLKFTYIPYVNGGYPNYKGQLNTVSQTGNYLNALSEQMFISNGLNQLQKGSLLKVDGAAFKIVGRFYDGQAFHSGLPADEFLHPFGYQLVYAMWQLYRKYMTSIEGDFLGLKCFAVLTVPDLYKTFFFTNPNPHVDNKFFILLHYEQDYDTQIWKAFFTEIKDTTVGFVFTDPYEFKYLTG